MTPDSRRRTAECASDWALDTWLAGELELEQGERLLAHTRECQPCTARLAELSRERAQFDVALPAQLAAARGARRLPALPGPRRARRVLALQAALAAAALVGGVFVFGRVADYSPTPPGERAKGSGRLGFFIKRGETVERGGQASILHPGDALQFTYAASVPGYVAVLSQDAQGVHVYYPSAARAAAIPAGEQLLPQSTILDDSVGVETLYGIFCARPLELEPLRAAWQQVGKPPPGLEGCTLDVLSVRKEAD